WVAACRTESWKEIFVGKEIVVDRAGLDHARPANQARRSIAALPIGRLLATVWGGATIRPRHHLGAVVRSVDHDRVVSDAPARNSSSTVSMRFFVSGPVSSILPSA